MPDDDLDVIDVDPADLPDIEVSDEALVADDETTADEAELDDVDGDEAVAR